MGKGVWPAEPPEAYLATMLRVLVVLLGLDGLENKVTSGHPNFRKCMVRKCVLQPALWSDRPQRLKSVLL